MGAYFCQMAMGVAVLGAENGTDFEDRFAVGGNEHLFVELW